jgi:hypothetical protein
VISRTWRALGVVLDFVFLAKLAHHRAVGERRLTDRHALGNEHKLAAPGHRVGGAARQRREKPQQEQALAEAPGHRGSPPSVRA